MKRRQRAIIKFEKFCTSKIVYACINEDGNMFNFMHENYVIDASKPLTKKIYIVDFVSELYIITNFLDNEIFSNRFYVYNSSNQTPSKALMELFFKQIFDGQLASLEQINYFCAYSHFPNPSCVHFSYYMLPMVLLLHENQCPCLVEINNLDLEKKLNEYVDSEKFEMFGIQVLKNLEKDQFYFLKEKLIEVYLIY